MPYVIMVLGVIASVGYYFHSIRNAGQAVGQVVDTALTIRGKLRRNAFKKKVSQSPLMAVQDPGTAAIILLSHIAMASDNCSDAHWAEIQQMASERMGMEDGEDVVVFAKWVCEQVISPQDTVRKLKPLWVENLNPAQLVELGRMADEVAAIHGPANGEQKEMIRKMREYLNIQQ